MQSTSFRRLPIHVAQRAGWILDLCGILQQETEVISSFDTQGISEILETVDTYPNSRLRAITGRSQKDGALADWGIGHLAEGEDI
jgi:hypothetical protein